MFLHSLKEKYEEASARRNCLHDDCEGGDCAGGANQQIPPIHTHWEFYASRTYSPAKASEGGTNDFSL